MQQECKDEYCCRIYNQHYHLGKCQYCPEFYDYKIGMCITCNEKYGMGSYYNGGQCKCAPGMAGYESKCVDCWSKQMVVQDYQCVQCSSLDELAIYAFDNNCQCTNNYTFDGHCSKQQQYSKSYTVLIISVVVPVVIIIIVLIVSIILIQRKKKLNAVEVQTKFDKAIQSEEKPTLNITSETIQIVDEISSKAEQEIQINYNAIDISIDDNNQQYLFNQ
ncbi:Hypothetical_protein [Hexamita inflata]|uniref:Hypothetical_protein n=1 Tax=Hexamita inflata TaxID=28002 RepID=A0AA86UD59_9EUKA|nr:Hypothetical protein HINF_LOCUS34127 [Hexamita inflata]